MEIKMVEAGYIREMDITVIWEYTYGDDGELIREEIIGFYHGSPDPELTRIYSHTGTMAVLMD